MNGPEALAGIGVDLVDIARVRRARFFDRVTEYVLTESERKTCRAAADPVQFFASRFAVKEAVIKATPVKMGYLDIETSKQGAVPVATYLRPEDQYAFRAQVSLSHVPDYAIGMAAVFRTT